MKKVRLVTMRVVPDFKNRFKGEAAMKGFTISAFSKHLSGVTSLEEEFRSKDSFGGKKSGFKFSL